MTIVAGLVVSQAHTSFTIRSFMSIWTASAFAFEASATSPGFSPPEN